MVEAPPSAKRSKAATARSASGAAPHAHLARGSVALLAGPVVGSRVGRWRPSVRSAAGLDVGSAVIVAVGLAFALDFGSGFGSGVGLAHEQRSAHVFDVALDGMTPESALKLSTRFGSTRSRLGRVHVDGPDDLGRILASAGGTP